MSNFTHCIKIEFLLCSPESIIRWLLPLVSDRILKRRICLQSLHFVGVRHTHAHVHRCIHVGVCRRQKFLIRRANRLTFPAWMFSFCTFLPDSRFVFWPAIIEYIRVTRRKSWEEKFTPEIICRRTYSKPRSDLRIPSFSRLFLSWDSSGVIKGSNRSNVLLFYERRGQNNRNVTTIRDRVKKSLDTSGIVQKRKKQATLNSRFHESGKTMNEKVTRFESHETKQDARAQIQQRTNRDFSEFKSISSKNYVWCFKSFSHIVNKDNENCWYGIVGLECINDKNNLFFIYVYTF